MLAAMHTTSSIALAALLIAAPALSQSPAQTDRTAEVDRIFSWATPGSPGCSVAAAHKGARVVDRAYGLADIESRTPITPDTLFDAGSVVKQFVAAAVLVLAEDGRLSLTDDIRKYIPELADTGHVVTIDHLLTHTSGVRDWTGIMPLASGEPDALAITLRQRGLNFAPGDEWQYSNGGYVLVKELVARVTGMPFGEYARTRLFEPFGMTSTRYIVDISPDMPQLARAYEKRGGEWRLDMLEGNARGGGGALLTTARDLLTWSEAIREGRLGAAVTARMHEPARLNDGSTHDYGRGVFLDDNGGGPVLWHTGSAAGYKSLVARFPAQQLSVAITCNAGEIADRTRFAAAIFDLFAPGARSEREPAGAETAAASESPARPAPPAQPDARYVPTAEELAAFAGRYESDEVGAVFVVTAGERGLTVQLEHAPERRLPLTAAARDTFRIARMTMRFERDGAGRSVALVYSNPVVRNIRFVRVDDAAR